MSLSDLSAAYWAHHQVAHFGPNVTTEESQAALDDRNSQYPGLLDLLPCNAPGKTILDFGCGPGHDTLMYLQNGARHVYAADVSWQGLNSLRYRLTAHGLLDRCTLMLVPENSDSCPPPVDEVLAAGVLHHCSDPVATLHRLASGLRFPGSILVMVYSAESWWYQVEHGGDPERFRQNADGGAPIARAWTPLEFRALAREAGLDATHLGGYRSSVEPEGPGLSACYRLVPQ